MDVLLQGFWESCHPKLFLGNRNSDVPQKECDALRSHFYRALVTKMHSKIQPSRRSHTLKGESIHAQASPLENLPSEEASFT